MAAEVLAPTMLMVLRNRTSAEEFPISSETGSFSTTHSCLSVFQYSRVEDYF